MLVNWIVNKRENISIGSPEFSFYSLSNVKDESDGDGGTLPDTLKLCLAFR
jgi:hypothetical protein